MKNREEIEDDYDFYETFDEDDNSDGGLDYKTFKEKYVDNKPEEEKDVSINATLESKTNLKWQKEIDIHRHFDTTIILEGNVNDKQIYIEDESIDITSTENYLYKYLHKIGYNTVIFFNNVEGFYCKHDKKEFDRFFKIVKNGEQQDDEFYQSNLEDYQSSAFGPALQDIRSAMKNRKEPVAIIMTGVSRYIANPNTISDIDQFFYSKLSLATKSVSGPSNNELHNMLFLIAEKVNDIPAWFYLNNPLVKTITLPIPDLNIRRMYIDAYYDDINGDTVEESEDIEKNKNLFVAYTESFKLVDLDSLRLLMQNEKLNVSQVSKGVSKFKYGTDENPWEDERLKKELSSLDEKLKERVKGQDKSIKKASSIIKSAVLGLSGLQHSSSKSKPRGIMFLAGPTGVGKTELAKTISEWLFKTEDSVIRFDMSEYSQAHTDQRLLGAPPGYVGYEQGGQLTEAVKRNPFSVLLFDEIEKAHPTILDKFLQILEDGRMTDGKGETVYFSDTLIIFTSNLGMFKEEKDQFGFTIRKPTVNYGEDGCNEKEDKIAEEQYNEYSKKIMDSINNFFTLKIERPEIKNRIGENFIVFDYISYRAAFDIAKKQIKAIQKNLLSTKNITLEISKEAMKDIIKELQKNEHISQGGRGVGNVIENMIIRPLSDYLVENSIFYNSEINIKNINKVNGNFVLEVENV